MKIYGLDSKYTSTGTYIVAFIDVLGTTKKVLKNTQDALEELWMLNHDIFKVAAEYDKEYGKECVIRSFSDNYLLALETSNETMPKDIEHIFNIVGNVFNFCLRMHSILLRGAIEIGELHIDENIVIGKALIDAYQTETKMAIYPRIIVSDHLVRMFHSDVENFCAVYDLTKPIFQDFDMLWCLNPLLFCAETTEKRSISSFQVGMATLLYKARKDNDKKVLTKLKWLINYVNQYYTQNEGVILLDSKEIDIT